MTSAQVTDEPYVLGPGAIYRPEHAVQHRDEEYDSHAFDQLLQMEQRHFWYAGRYRFILHCLNRQLRRTLNTSRPLTAVDLGGGCGGWVKYLREHAPNRFAELALADSSPRALELAANVVGDEAKRYQIDLLDLQWRERWDLAFLLDVLEHIPEDVKALEQIWAALRPGGLLFVATPALRFFWSYNDEVVHHVRRYSRDDFRRLAEATRFECAFSRYFMFFLSPLLLLSRIRRPNLQEMTPDQIRDHCACTHRVPAAPMNQALRLVFSLETPLGCWLPFPWGTSVLAVLRKPSG
jgi:SAM-dependent methyltransferase